MEGQRAYHLFRGDLRKDAVGVLLLHALDDTLHLRLLGRATGQHPCWLRRGCLNWCTCTCAQTPMERPASHPSVLETPCNKFGRSPFSHDACSIALSWMLVICPSL